MTSETDWVEVAAMLGGLMMMIVPVVGLPVTFVVTVTLLSVASTRHRGA